jgi:hypothetical protein
MADLLLLGLLMVLIFVVSALACGLCWWLLMEDDRA